MRLYLEMPDYEQILAPLKGLSREMGQVVNSALRRAGQAMRTNLTQGIRRESFLKSGSIRGDIKKPVLESGLVSVTVGSKMHGADSFRLVPNRITARKGMQSRKWPSAAFQVGPHVPVWNPKSGNGRSRAFVLLARGKKRMYRWNGKSMERVSGVTSQYFSVFPQVRQPVLSRGREIFEKRLLHEVEFRLGKMK